MRTVVMTTLGVGLSAALVSGQGFEGPPTFKASELLEPAQIKGPHYTVDDKVPAEGFFYEFTIRSDFGVVEADGLDLLRTRLTEVGALAQLQEVSKTDIFLSAAGRSLESVGQGVASAVKDPGATAKGIGKGVKRFGVNLGRKVKRGADDAADAVSGDEKKNASGADDKPGATESVANAALGVNKSARIWARKLGVDPYTTNPVLSKALLEVGKLDATAGIATKIVIPVPSVVSVTSSVGNLVWGKDPEELRKLNEAGLTELGVPADVRKAFFRNAAFTLTLQTRFVAALKAVKAKGLADYVDAARGAEQERQALFFTESAEMLQQLHAGTPVQAVLTDSRAMVAKAGGRAIAVLPLDYVRWADNVKKAGGEMAERAKKELGASALEMRLTGKASARARKELAALGWKLAEGAALPQSGSH